MKSISCPHCSRSVSAADEAWDRAAATGACPYCGKLLDAAKEAEAVATASIDKGVQLAARKVRLSALGLGVSCFLATGLLLVAFDRLWYWLPVVGLANLGIAWFYNPAAEARNRVKAQTDLSKFT